MFFSKKSPYFSRFRIVDRKNVIFSKFIKKEKNSPRFTYLQI